jgi:hypothetical protein
MIITIVLSLTIADDNQRLYDTNAFLELVKSSLLRALGDEQKEGVKKGGIKYAL